MKIYANLGKRFPAGFTINRYSNRFKQTSIGLLSITGSLIEKQAGGMVVYAIFELPIN